MTRHTLCRHAVASLIGIILVFVLAGCASTVIATHPPAPTSTPKPAHAGQTAAQLMAGLKAAGLPIGLSVVFTADTDENHLLGRPNQYIGKASWHDTRVPDSGARGPDISVDDGGSIEVFANPVDAQNRYTYIQGIVSQGSLFVEYDYLSGDALLRVSHYLTPDEANAYKEAFNALP